MREDIPIDLYNFCAILVKDGNTKQISSLLKVKDIILDNWDSANQKMRDSKISNKESDYGMIIVSNQIENLNYIILDNNQDFKYAMNICNELSKEYRDVFYFLIDVHSGLYKFIKFEERKISRFFERDSNQLTGEFGQKTEEELKIKTESKDFFYLIEVVKEVLKWDKLS